MKKYQKKVSSLLLLGFLLNIFALHSQTKNDILIYKWFDNSLGKENLDINSGTIHSNPYKTLGDNNMYYSEDKYELGTLNFDNQAYYDVYLKYDLYNNTLILNPSGLSANIGINLNPYKVESFTIKGNHFVKIEKKDNLNTELTTGYYEENKITPGFIFYIKHHKDIQKNISDKGLVYKFNGNNSFFIKLNGSIYKIESKNEIIKLFPEQKKQINEFYIMNGEIKKSNLNLFMENLMRYINNSILLLTK